MEGAEDMFVCTAKLFVLGEGRVHEKLCLMMVLLYPTFIEETSPPPLFTIIPESKAKMPSLRHNISEGMLQKTYNSSKFYKFFQISIYDDFVSWIENT